MQFNLSNDYYEDKFFHGTIHITVLQLFLLAEGTNVLLKYYLIYRLKLK